MTQPQDELSEDVIFDIMSNRRRRFVLTYLREQGGSVPLGKIASALAAAESDTSPEQVDRQARKRAYVSLYQTHIPRLTEERIVEYDEETGEVTLLTPAEQVLARIDQGGGGRWPRVYVALAVVALALYLPPLAGLVPVTEWLWVAGVLVPLAVLAVGVLHWRAVAA